MSNKNIFILPENIQEDEEEQLNHLTEKIQTEAERLDDGQLEGEENLKKLSLILVKKIKNYMKENIKYKAKCIALEQINKEYKEILKTKKEEIKKLKLELNNKKN